MPYSNSDLMTDKEFYSEVARLLNVKPATVRKYWTEGFYEVIIRSLYFRGNCRTPSLGTFSLRHVAEGLSKQTDSNGEEVVYRIPERDVPIFKPHDDAINDCNMMGVTKAYRKRMKANKLTKKDYERQIRAEKLGVFGSMSAERIENSKEDFRKKLQEKVKETETNGKNDE